MLKLIAPGLLLVYLGTRVYGRAQVLPQTENCATVYCASLQCSNQYKPPGSCCPVCQSTVPDGAPVGPDIQPYDSPDNQGPDERYRSIGGPGPEPYPQPPGGGVYPPECASVPCAQPACPNSYIPPGSCCAVCPHDGPGDTPSIQPGGGVLPPNCASVPCAQPACSNPYIPPGGCCAVCSNDGPGDTPSLQPGGGVLPPNCASVPCAHPACSNPYIPPGGCCAVCSFDGPGDTPSLQPDGPGPQPHDIPDALGPDDIYRQQVGPGPEPYPQPPVGPVPQPYPPVGPGPEPYPQPPVGPIGPDPRQQSGGLECQNMKCSQLRCREQYTPPGQCCPVCTGDPTGQY